MANEDTIYEYLQDGVDTYAANSITTNAIAVGAVTSADILDGTITTTDLAFAINPGNTLPAGAIFFMVTGSCPSWTTDVSTTYANLFVRINATQGSLGGSNTHTHGVGSYLGTSHTHTVPIDGWGSQDPGAGSGRMVTTTEASGASNDTATTSQATSSSGSGAITGTSASGDNLPAFVTMKACQVS